MTKPLAAISTTIIITTKIKTKVTIILKIIKTTLTMKLMKKNITTQIITIKIKTIAIKKTKKKTIHRCKATRRVLFVL